MSTSRVQDVVLIFSLITIFLTFANTYIFQAGMIGVLLRQFRASIVVVSSYLVLSVTYHVLLLRARWDPRPGELLWTPGFVAGFVCHRVGKSRILVLPLFVSCDLIVVFSSANDAQTFLTFSRCILLPLLPSYRPEDGRPDLLRSGVLDEVGSGRGAN